MAFDAEVKASVGDFQDVLRVLVCCKVFVEESYCFIECNV